MDTSSREMQRFPTNGGGLCQSPPAVFLLPVSRIAGDLHNAQCDNERDGCHANDMHYRHPFGMVFLLRIMELCRMMENYMIGWCWDSNCHFMFITRELLFNG